jgi:hypothetical protein
MARGIKLAEAVRFELTKDSRPCRFSRPVHSTALPRFQCLIISYFRHINQAKISEIFSYFSIMGIDVVLITTSHH